MTFLRLLAATFALSIAFSADSVAETRAKKGQSDGTFAGIEQGDYAHFLLKDTKGKPNSYFILRPDKSVQAFLDNARKLKGRRVRVYWEERDQEIPEAGGKQRIKVVTKVEQQT